MIPSEAFRFGLGRVGEKGIGLGSLETSWSSLGWDGEWSFGRSGLVFKGEDGVLSHLLWVPRVMVPNGVHVGNSHPDIYFFWRAVRQVSCTLKITPKSHVTQSSDIVLHVVISLSPNGSLHGY